MNKPNKPNILHIGLCVNPNDPTHGLKRAFIEASADYREINTGDRELNKKIIEITKEFKPDLVFMQIQEGGKIHDTVIKHLRDLGAIVFNWNGDVRNEVPAWMVGIGNDVSKTLFSNMRDVRSMWQRGMRSDWLEIWVDKDIYKPEGHALERVRPIVFFGNNTHSFPLSGFRAQMCDELRAVFGPQFGEYGNGPKAVEQFNHSQPEEAAAYRNAKIAINVSHYEIERYTSDRLYRILSTGAAICLAKGFQGIEELFEDGTHLRVWNTMDELKALIRYYMDPANEEERRRIARVGMEHCHANFSCQAFVKNLLQYYYDELDENR